MCHLERRSPLQKRYRIFQKRFGRQWQHSSLTLYHSCRTCYNTNQSCRYSLCSSHFPHSRRCCQA
jgi:hypothetical protein